ncbi:hypothetical protein Prudu_013388 [Prunus dulcis]|uniref:Uncharacterized protein n=1 Tax=Prunus dulcis TaxID=3755 RepID=A0A4Y1RFK3_PRUDU|nr:hypothetical protein Prudu_013388 [Prunus dulcis]
MFLNHCGYPVTETGCRQIKRCLRTSRLPSVYVAFGGESGFSQNTGETLLNFQQESK